MKALEVFLCIFALADLAYVYGKYGILRKMDDKIQVGTDMHESIRQHVIEVAKKAFYAKGIKNVTMDEIAHELTMSKRTLYQLFSDKESLLLACIEEQKHRHLLLMQECMEHTDNVLELVLADFSYRLDFIKGITPQFFVDVNRFPKVVESMQKDRLQHMEKAVAFLEKGVSQGLFRADVNFEIIYTLLMSHVDNSSATGSFSHFPPVEVFKHLVFFFLRGCTTQKGMEMMDEYIVRNGWS